MTFELALLLAISVLCDVAGQMAFKHGADRIPSATDAGFSGFAAALVRNPSVLLGLAIYILEFVIWLRILSLAPLAVAFPLASLNIIAIVFAGRVFLNEPVGARQWLGALLVTVGVIAVARTL